MKQGFVYIMANNRPTLHVSVTSNLVKRVYEHKNNFVLGFTAKYKLHKLVYYDTLVTIQRGIIREKQVKDMNREDKLKMIYLFNRKFRDLYQPIR